MTALTVRGFRKNAAPGFYNLRHRPSQGKDNIYFHSASNIHGSEGAEPSKTNRDPTKFAYSNNIFRNDYMEWRMRAADYLYQIGSRLHRSNDAWTRTLLAYSGFTFMMFSQALFTSSLQLWLLLPVLEIRVPSQPLTKSGCSIKFSKTRN